ncbi:transposase [Streptomyces sp. NPDC053069]|uniref:transposase n=1 Tax=Streptomyces sp. NPDC053069 TaxID=3365695 RepID=UPI0037D0B5CB
MKTLIVRAHQHAAATGRTAAQPRQEEQDDHALGRSRGGLTTKIHLACDGRGRPLAVLLSPGQRNDSPCARPLLERNAYLESDMAAHAAAPIT